MANESEKLELRLRDFSKASWKKVDTVRKVYNALQKDKPKVTFTQALERIIDEAWMNVIQNKSNNESELKETSE